MDKMKGEPALLLSEKVRARLKRPLGQLFSNIGSAIEYLRKLKPHRLITIGDIVGAGFIAAGVKPDVVVVDFFVMRTPAPPSIRVLIDSFEASVIHVKNPAGTLTSEMRNSLAEAKPPVKIIVEGEEDLATIPAVISAPLGSAVVYGQPAEGIVLIEVTEAKRKEFMDIIKDLKPANES